MTLRDEATTGERSLRTDDRAWTAAEKHKLRGLAKNNTPVRKIARPLSMALYFAATQLPIYILPRLIESLIGREKTKVPL